MPAKNILIVDDERDICILLGALLTKRNYNVHFALSLEEARARIPETKPGLIFLDIHLPDGSGLDFVPFIRNNYPEIKIVMMSAYDGEPEREQAKAAGVNEFVGKPLSQQKVDDVLQRMIRKRSTNNG